MTVARSYRTRRVRTIATTRYEFNASDLRKALDLPNNTAFHVRVPGGGDWSNTNLDIAESDHGQDPKLIAVCIEDDEREG